MAKNTQGKALDAAGLPADVILHDPSHARENGELTPRRIHQNAFLRAFECEPRITTAAAKVGIARQTHYDWLNDDPTYLARYEAAAKRAGWALEELSLELCYGWDEPVFHEGKVCGTIRKYDTRHMREMLAAAIPEKYRKRSEIGGIGGKPLFDVEAIRAYMAAEPGDDEETTQ